MIPASPPLFFRILGNCALCGAEDGTHSTATLLPDGSKKDEKIVCQECFPKTLPQLPESPADPDEMNDARASWAAVAIESFVAATRTDPEDALADLLGNLMHWSDRNGLDFETELERGRGMYAEETQPG